MIPIQEPLPLVAEGDDPWCLSAEMLNLLARKVNALTSMRAIEPLRIIQTEAGPVLTTGRGGLIKEGDLPSNATIQWVTISLCVGGVPTSYSVPVGVIPA